MLFLAYQLNLISQIPPSTSILNRNWGTYIGGNSSEGIPGGLVLDSIGNIYISSSVFKNILEKLIYYSIYSIKYFFN